MHVRQWLPSFVNCRSNRTVFSSGSSLAIGSYGCTNHFATAVKQVYEDFDENTRWLHFVGILEPHMAAWQLRTLSTLAVVAQFIFDSLNSYLFRTHTCCNLPYSITPCGTSRGGCSVFSYRSGLPCFILKAPKRPFIWKPTCMKRTRGAVAVAIPFLFQV